MSDEPTRGRRNPPRGYMRGTPRVQSSTLITVIEKKATKNDLREFKRLWLNQEHTQVWATTDDPQLAKRWKHYRDYLRDSERGVWEYELVFGEASVTNAEVVLRENRH